MPARSAQGRASVVGTLDARACRCCDGPAATMHKGIDASLHSVYLRAVRCVDVTRN